MKAFPHELTLSESYESRVNGSLRIAFSFQGMAITDPLRSSCGRFEAKPSDYGLSDADVQYLQHLNETVDSAVDDALDAACLKIQSELCVDTGDLAGMVFAGHISIRAQLWKSLAEYLLLEVASARQELMASQAKEPAKDLSPSIGNSRRSEGMVFKQESRGDTSVWVNRHPLPRGSVEVISLHRNGVPIDLESECIQVTVNREHGYLPRKFVFTGRTGMNDTYREVVGYRPDDEEYEPEPKALLAQLVEMLYRNVTGDDQ